MHKNVVKKLQLNRVFRSKSVNKEVKQYEPNLRGHHRIGNLACCKCNDPEIYCLSKHGYATKRQAVRSVLLTGKLKGHE